MWNQLGKLFLAVATGDAGKAAEVLHEAPEETPIAPRNEGDPPCGKADGQTRCMGHGAGGACVMGAAT